MHCSVSREERLSEVLTGGGAAKLYLGESTATARTGYCAPLIPTHSHSHTSMHLSQLPSRNVLDSRYPLSRLRVSVAINDSAVYYYIRSVFDGVFESLS